MPAPQHAHALTHGFAHYGMLSGLRHEEEELKLTEHRLVTANLEARTSERRVDASKALLEKRQEECQRRVEGARLYFAKALSIGHIAAVSLQDTRMGYPLRIKSATKLSLMQLPNAVQRHLVLLLLSHLLYFNS